jgi:starch synthase
LLPARYDAADPSGKAECKRTLQEALGFRQDPALPLFGTVSRIDPQKGIDLIGGVAPGLVDDSAQLVVLGTGQQALLDELRALARAWTQSVAVVERFDEEAAHRIYAGADFFLMPSRFEPCGLGQLVALRYGTPPIVHRTGGLADTVRDVDAHPGAGNGFSFDVPDARGLAWACGRAARTFRESPDRLARLRRRGMREDLSWTRSARAHLGVLELATRRERVRVMDG